MIVGVQYTYGHIPRQNIPLSLPGIIAQINHEARHEAYKYRFTLPHSRYDLKRRSLPLQTPHKIVANLSVDTLWLKTGTDDHRDELKFRELQLMLEALERAQPQPFGTPPNRRLVIPWTCVEHVFGAMDDEVQRFESLVRLLIRSGLKEVLLVTDRASRYSLMGNSVEFRPADKTHPSSMARGHEFLIFIFWLCYKAKYDQHLHPDRQRLQKIGKEVWEELGSKVFDAFEHLRIANCKQVQALKDRNLRPDEFDKELERNDLIGYEYWKVPTFRFCKVRELS
jgi:hypothetical protein